jgi:hypothetical protein
MGHHHLGAATVILEFDADLGGPGIPPAMPGEDETLPFSSATDSV